MAQKLISHNVSGPVFLKCKESDFRHAVEKQGWVVLLRELLDEVLREDDEVVTAPAKLDWEGVGAAGRVIVPLKKGYEAGQTL